jgi:hypothetical protein
VTAGRADWPSCAEGGSYPDSLPHFFELKTDALGNVWIGEYRKSRDRERHWMVFDSRGHLLGPIRTPTDLNILEIGAEYILGVARDELRVEHVPMHRIVKSAG